MPSFLSSLFGSKPSLPTLPPLNLSTEQGKAIQGNLQNLPQAEQLASSANLFSQEQIDRMLQNSIPGYAAMQTGAAGVIGSEIAGQIPADVQAQIQNSAAARSIAGGFSGSGSEANLVARDLGLTSLQLTQQGINSFEQWQKTAASIYEPSMMNVQSMFVNPQQQAAFDVNERNMQFQRQWLQNQINAMPDPTTVGLWNASWSVVDAALSAYTGQNVQTGQINPQGSFSQYAGSGLGGSGEGGAGFGGGGGFSDAGGAPSAEGGEGGSNFFGGF